MTTEIVKVTDFTAIEDAIETWVLTASQFPAFTDRPAAHWEGYDLERERPYILISPITQPTPGQPWEEKELINESGTDKWETTYYHPFRWNIQFTAYTDSKDEDGRAIRLTGYRYMQNVINNAQIPEIKNILNAVNMSYHTQTQTVTPNVLPAVDDDKYIHQGTIEYMFSGIVETKLKDTDFFTSVDTPTTTLTEE